MRARKQAGGTREMDVASEAITKKLSFYTPRLGLSCLILCLASGIFLAFQYNPFGNAFQNVEEITTRIPFGWLFRQMHYASGQAFVILMLFHTAEHFLKKRYRNYPASTWALLVTSIGLCFFALFTGYILKGDREGMFAGRILVNTLGTIPVAGEPMARIFLDPSRGFFLLPYLHHCLILPLLIIALLRRHIREWLPNRIYMALTLGGLLLYALLVEPWMDVPPGTVSGTAKGPWFFLGLQYLFKTFDPLWAGIVAPAVFLGLVLSLPKISGKAGWYVHHALALIVSLYAGLTVRAAFL